MVLLLIKNPDCDSNEIAVTNKKFNNHTYQLYKNPWKTRLGFK